MSDGGQRAVPPGYPAELERVVEAADGRPVAVRPIRPDDGDALVAFHAALSPHSVHMRFFGAHPRLAEREVEHFTHVDYQDRLALVAVVDGRVAAVARYDRPPGTAEAEVAFVVADELQHHGIGTLLLELLAEAAWTRGITEFVAQTLVGNQDMMDVFVGSGFEVTRHRVDDVVDLRFSIEPTERYLAAVAERHRGPAESGRAC